jgi:hypothetical protein
VMTRTTVAIFVVATALVMVAAGPAAARRAPTPPEAKALRAAFTAFLKKPNSPAARDNKIVKLAVSTVDNRYAAAVLNSPTAGPSDMVFHRIGYIWKVTGFGSSLQCSAAPKAVLKDLRVGCSP